MIAAKAIVHPTAIISANVVVHEFARIGPYSVIGSSGRHCRIEIGSHANICSNVVIEGETIVGENTTVHPFTTLGSSPQDMKHNPNARSQLRIGKNCVIREHASIHGGSEGGGQITRLGDNCLVMTGVHIAHDCILSDKVIIASNSVLAGHVHVGESAIVGGGSAVLQFVHIGRNAMLGGMSALSRDLVPYGLAVGNRASLRGLNLVGLRRLGCGTSVVAEALRQFRYIFQDERGLFRSEDGSNGDGLTSLRERTEYAKAHSPNNNLVQHIADFILVRSRARPGLCTPPRPQEILQPEKPRGPN